MKESTDSTLHDKLPGIRQEEAKGDCGKHGVFSGMRTLWNGRPIEPTCPKCAEEQELLKKQAEAQEEAKKKAMARRMRIERRLKGAMIPERFASRTFENFIDDTEGRATQKRVCLQYAEYFPDALKAGRCMVLCGKTGTGKTHLACAIARYVIDNHDVSAVFMKVIKAVRMVKETYSKGSDSTEQQAIDFFVQPDLLILDEIGIQFGSLAEKNILFEILNERYENMRPTILLSNKTAAEMKDFVGDRVLDRFRENGGKLLRFDWESYRASG